MDNGRYYIGTDLKFKITLTAEGFDQGRDNYEIDFYCGDGHKHFTQDDVVKGTDGNFYIFIPTSDFTPGITKMVITAYIPDRDISGGVRKEIESIILGPLKPAI